MELILKGTSDEIKNALQANNEKCIKYISPIDGKEHVKTVPLIDEKTL